MDKSNEKFELERDIKAPLTMYFFIVQDERIAVSIPIDVKAILAYNILNAVEMVKKDYPAGTRIVVEHKGSISMKNILDVTNIDSSTVKLPVKEPSEVRINEIVLPPQEKMTKQQFVNNCLLIANQFITVKRDRDSFKRILDKIKTSKHAKVTVKKKS